MTNQLAGRSVRLPAITSEVLPSGRVRVGFRPPKSRRRIARTFDHAAVGEAWAEESRLRIVGALMAGEDVEAAIDEVLGVVPVLPSATTDVPEAATSPTLAKYAREWLDAKRGGIDLVTFRWYGTHVDGFLDDADLAATPIAEITRRQVEEWRTRDLDAGVGRPTSNARLKVLGMVLRFALDDRLIPSNPTSSVSSVKTETAEKPTLDLGGQARLLADPKLDPSTDLGRRHRLFVLVGLFAGLRFEEAAALDASSLTRTDDGQAYLTITRVRRRNGEIRPWTKSGKPRRVPVGGDVLTLWAEVALATAPGALMFPWKYDSYRHSTWKGITDRAGLNRQKSTANGTKAVRFGYHSLRHTYGSRLAAANTPRSEIALLMGHADESTTAGYIHASIDGARHDAVLAALGMTTA